MRLAFDRDRLANPSSRNGGVDLTEAMLACAPTKAARTLWLVTQFADGHAGSTGLT
jgi:hypothetical protein